MVDNEVILAKLMELHLDVKEARKEITGLTVGAAQQVERMAAITERVAVHNETLFDPERGVQSNLLRLQQCHNDRACRSVWQDILVQAAAQLIGIGLPVLVGFLLYLYKAH